MQLAPYLARHRAAFDFVFADAPRAATGEPEEGIPPEVLVRVRVRVRVRIRVKIRVRVRVKIRVRVRVRVRVRRRPRIR